MKKEHLEYIKIILGIIFIIALIFEKNSLEKWYYVSQISLFFATLFLGYFAYKAFMEQKKQNESQKEHLNIQKNQTEEERRKENSRQFLRSFKETFDENFFEELESKIVEKDNFFSSRIEINRKQIEDKSFIFLTIKGCRLNRKIDILKYERLNLFVAINKIIDNKELIISFNAKNLRDIEYTLFHMFRIDGIYKELINFSNKITEDCDKLSLMAYLSKFDSFWIMQELTLMPNRFIEELEKMKNKNQYTLLQKERMEGIISYIKFGIPSLINSDLENSKLNMSVVYDNKNSTKQSLYIFQSFCRIYINNSDNYNQILKLHEQGITKLNKII